MFETAKPFLLSLALGLLIGIERERSFAGVERSVSFGARTFTLIALLGSVAGYLGSPGLSVVFAGFIAALALAASCDPAPDADTTPEPRPRSRCC